AVEWNNDRALYDFTMLLFGFLSVFPHEPSVRRDLQAPFFPFLLNGGLVVPLAVLVVFPFYGHDFSCRCRVLDRLLNSRWKRVHVDGFAHFFSSPRCAAHGQSGANQRSDQQVPYLPFLYEGYSSLARPNIVSNRLCDRMR